jgi:hypothetical protein
MIAETPGLLVKQLGLENDLPLEGELNKEVEFENYSVVPGD